MARREQAPYAPQDPHEIRTMLQGLEAHQRKGKGQGGFSVKKATFKLPNGRTVDSWRLQDWDYKKPNLPTYARGLFTHKTLAGEPEIAVRGYDKFFNHGEVQRTEWGNVKRTTRGPYELSVKENGCIIFIAGLDDGTLLVCSKHSIGERADADVSHAVAGEKWVERHLASVGKSKEELARKLREMNATAVAELCDDAFEEHVLAYEPAAAGLYLHGINLNLPEFATYPGHLVDKFADEWGFRKTMYIIKDDIDEVKTFLDKVAETGNYDGRDTEGFVIRCQARESGGGEWGDWFFKYKFEEPYLMYRQWRECTKAIIAGKAPRVKKHKKITEEYLLYARRRFVKEPQLTKLYNQNHGIIALRDDFLKERNITGAEIIRRELADGEETADADVTQNVVLMPVATIGCGKTTVALALTKLFDWGHFQNDNIEGKARRPERFVTALCHQMLTHSVTIADRNNHQKRERKQLIGDISRNVPDAKFVAYQYVHDRYNYDRIREVTRARVLDRGDNHQTIQAGSKGRDEIVGIMEGFLERFQPVDASQAPDDAFELVINLDPCADSRENLEVVVARMHEHYPALFARRAMPTADDLDKAVDAAMNEYEVTLKHDLGRPGDKKQKSKHDTQVRLQMERQMQDLSTDSQPTTFSNQQQQQQHQQPKQRKPPRVEFFAVRLPADRVAALLDSAFRDQPPDVARTYRQLQQARRVQPEFHVTLAHRAAASSRPQLWDALMTLHEHVTASAPATSEPDLGRCVVALERLVWNARVMCFVARLCDGVTAPADGARPYRWETANAIAHVTVGTASADIKPVESNGLLEQWDRGAGGVQELPLEGGVELDGVVRGVLSRF